MKEDKANQIIAKYPELFKETFYGIECDVGWYDLIDQLCATIQNHFHYIPDEIKEHIYVSQIKEKFGLIRIYFNQTTPYIDGAIAMTEAMSSHICEKCALPASTRQGSWIKTLCDSCDVKSK